MLLDRATEMEMERKDEARVICIFKRLDSIGYDNEAIPLFVNDHILLLTSLRARTLLIISIPIISSRLPLRRTPLLTRQP